MNRSNNKCSLDVRRCICNEMLESFVGDCSPPSLQSSVVLDLGCGGRKLRGSVGIDIVRTDAVDVLFDLDGPSWPLRDQSIDAVWMNQAIEHVQDVVVFLATLHACLRPGADVVLLAPHFSSVNAWSDPTHRRGFALLSLDYAMVYIPGSYRVVHRFFGMGSHIHDVRNPIGLFRSGVAEVINRNLTRQRAYERWVTPWLAAGVIGYHLRRL
jgi:SAM-dependent methyltransferase